MFPKLKRLVLLFLVFASIPAFSSGGKIINPITDICWSCLFPLHVAGGNKGPSDIRALIYSKETFFWTLLD